MAMVMATFTKRDGSTFRTQISLPAMPRIITEEPTDSPNLRGGVGPVKMLRREFARLQGEGTDPLRPEYREITCEEG